MDVDLLLDPFAATFDELVGAARRAEELGFAGVWTWDHLAGGVHRAPRVLECWTVLSALAAVTSRVALGPMVLNVANRPAGLVAVMAATLQEASGGRLLLGLGAGGGGATPYAAEQEALGRPVGPDPVRRRHVEETVVEIRRLWAGDPPPGGFLRPRPVPPIVVGGFGPRMAALAGRVADGVNLPDGPRLGRLVEVARGAHAQAGGDPGRFLVTVSGRLDARTCDPGGGPRRRLEALGVDRHVLVVHPADRETIEEAGRALRPAG